MLTLLAITENNYLYIINHLYLIILLGSQNPKPRSWNNVKKTIEFTENYKLYNMKKKSFLFHFF